MPTPEQPSRSSDSPGPDPESTPGLERGNGVQPGDTPPMADSASGASPSERRDGTPNMGPVVPNRTPMIITLVVLAIVVLLVLGYGVAEIAAYLREQPGEESLGALLPPAAA